MNINESLQAERGEGQREREEEKGKRKEHRNNDRDFQVKEEKLKEGSCINREKNHTESPLPLLGFQRASLSTIYANSLRSDPLHE